MKKTYYRDFREFERAWEYTARRSMLGHNVQIARREDTIRVFFSATRIDVACATEVPKGDTK